MRLINLHLVAYRQYLDSVFDFSLGLTALIGHNGAGKSTVLEAIVFVLYGEQRSTKDTIRNLNADPKSRKFSATLKFELGGRIYEAMRSNDSASLTDLTEAMPKILASSLSEVTNAIEKLLGLNYEELINSFVVEQKGVDFLAFKNNADKQKRVSKMVGLDRLQVAEDAAKVKRDAAKLRAQTLASVMGDVESLKASVATAESDLAAIGMEITTNAASLEECLNSRPNVEALAAKGNRFNVLNGEIGVLKGQAETLKLGVQTAELEVEASQVDVDNRARLEPDALQFASVDKERNELLASRRSVDRRAEIIRALADLNLKLQSLTEAISKLPTFNLDGLKTGLAESKAKHADLTKSLEVAKSSWQAAQLLAATNLAKAKAALDAATSARVNAEAKIASGICPVCDQPLGASAKGQLNALLAAEMAAQETLEEAEASSNISAPAEIAGLTADLIEIQTLISVTEREIEDARNAGAQLLGHQSAAQSAKEQIDLLEKELAGLPIAYNAQRFAEIEAIYPSLKQSYDSHASLAGADARLAKAKTAHATADAALQEAKKQNAEKRAERDALGFKPSEEIEHPERIATEAAAAAIRALTDLTTRITVLESEGRGLVQRRTSAEGALASAKQRIEEYNLRQAELQSSEKERALYDTAHAELRSLRVKLNAQLGPDLAARASEILSILTSGRYNLVELDDKFNATIIDDGVSKSVLSGGEEDAVAISLRIALAEYIQEQRGMVFSILIFDEIATSLDADRRQALIDSLVGLKSRFEQIILISHIEGFVDIADQCIYLRRDPETKSTVVSDSPEQFASQEQAA